MPMSDGERSERLRVAILISTRERRFDPGPADWIATKVRRRADFDVDVLDLADAYLPEVAPVAGRPTPHAVQDLAPWLAAADAFIVLVPDGESLPTSLQAATEWYREEWFGKPISFIAYGPHTCRVQTVEHLREVFVGLDMAVLRDLVALDPAADPAGDCGADADAVLDQLAWWARTLRSGRAAQPYPAYRTPTRTDQD